MAFCTGCGKLFEQTHILRDHRHTFRCGGRWNHLNVSENKPGLVDITNPLRLFTYNYLRKPKNVKTGNAEPVHHERTPGTTRPTRLVGGPGYRNRELGVGTGARKARLQQAHVG